MQRWSLCAALGIVVVSGCTNAASPAADQPRPIAYDPLTAIAPNCVADRSIDYPAYTRTIDIVKRSGDLARAQAYYDAVRAEVERVLKARNPAALTEAAPVLAPLFSEQSVRKQATCDFTRYSRNPPMIDAWGAWVSDARLRQLHERIVSDAPAAPVAASTAPSGARRALLLRVWTATGRIDLAATRRQVLQRIAADVEARLDPLVSEYRLAYGVPVPVQETEQAGVDVRLAQRLSGVPDRDVEAFLAWAESGPGQAYYRALTATYTSAQRDWAGLLGEQVRTRIAPMVVSFGNDQIAAQLDEIGRLLEIPDTIYNRYPLRDKLNNLALRDRENPRIRVLLAKLELDVAGGPSDMARPRDMRLLRDSDLPPDASEFQSYSYFVVAVERALAVAADDADAHALAGHLAFLKLDDAKAAEHFAQARRIDAGNPLLALFEGDLAYAQKQYPKAEKLYRAAIAKAGDRMLTRHRAVMHLGLVLDATGRSKERADLVRSQLPLTPEGWQRHHDYAHILLDQGAKSGEVAALVAPIPKGWLPDLMSDLRSRLTVQRIIDAPASARLEVAKGEFAKSFDTNRYGVAACRAHDPAVIPVVRAARSGQHAANEVDNALFGCAIEYRRPHVLAMILPSIKDVNMPINALWQNPAVCGAAARSDDRSLALLIKAGADIERPCRPGGSARQILAAAVARGDVEAKAALAVLDGGAARH
ncbi:tetratricopeptide repeat protein [Lysobacter brunescens]|uniref:Tetratricopeptide repeat protein n=1 Tax=Lysobacter brunescens TaxID=262323 RepID=A0ABW2YAQ5_9GAMM